MSLPLPISLALEHGIESLLRLDPDTRLRLNELEGKVIAVQCTAPRITVVVSVVESKVNVIGGTEMLAESPADTTISGSLTALRSLSRGNGAVYRGDVKIEGDLGIGLAIKSLIAELDPDWEDMLSPLIGDSLVHRLGVLGHSLSGWLHRTRSGIAQNTSDYLQEEIELLAPNSEVRLFCNDVDETQAAVDRLDARIRLLEKRQRACEGESGC